MAYLQTHSQLTVAVDFGRLDGASGGEIERPGHVHGDTEIVSLLQRLADALRALRDDVGDACAARPAGTRSGAVVGDVRKAIHQGGHDVRAIRGWRSGGERGGARGGERQGAYGHETSGQYHYPRHCFTTCACR